MRNTARTVQGLTRCCGAWKGGWTAQWGHGQGGGRDLELCLSLHPVKQGGWLACAGLFGGRGRRFLPPRLRRCLLLPGGLVPLAGLTSIAYSSGDSVVPVREEAREAGAGKCDSSGFHLSPRRRSHRSSLPASEKVPSSAVLPSPTIVTYPYPLNLPDFDFTSSTDVTCDQCLGQVSDSGSVETLGFRATDVETGVETLYRTLTSPQPLKHSWTCSSVASHGKFATYIITAPAIFDIELIQNEPLAALASNPVMTTSEIRQS